MKKISKILAANRSEIAIRIFRAAEESNIKTAAIYSKEDRFAIHRFKTDESYLVGEGKGPIQAYLDIDSIIKNFDIICDGTDNFNTRYLINDYCKKNKKILISAAISKFDGHLFKYNFKKKGPCLRCFMPDQPLQENNCETEGIFPPVAGIIGALQANEVLKTVLNLKDDLNNNILVFNSLSMSLRKI